MPEFIRAGLNPNFVSYEAGLAMQRKLHARVSSGEQPDTCLLLEHESVFTAGKRTEDDERPNESRPNVGIPVYETDRGGKITWHGPGQLVGYPIMQLPRPIDVVGYVRWLEGVLIQVCADLGLQTQRVEGRSGVWHETSEGFLKIAAIGIRVADHTTMHGFALNCNNSLEPYEAIVACGIRDASVSTISLLTGQEVTPAMAAERVEHYLTKIGEYVQ